MPKYFKVVWHSALLNTTSHSYDQWWRPPFWLSQHCCLYWSVHGIINCESVLKQTWITFNYILKKKPKKPSTRNSYSLTLPICSTHTFTQLWRILGVFSFSLFFPQVEYYSFTGNLFSILNLNPGCFCHVPCFWIQPLLFRVSNHLLAKDEIFSILMPAIFEHRYISAY